jgi:site-specific DNA-methyltransferase (adenine-specific)
MPTLTWPGKALPPPQPANLNLDSIIYPAGSSPTTSHPANRLVLGDNLTVMQALLPEFEGRINLIYADPPFFTNRKFRTRIGRNEDSRKPAEWQMAEGYHDDWQTLDDYLAFLYSRLTLMHKLLAPNGTLYLHLDWHADAYARLLLDEIFGSEYFLNEIIWTYHGPSPIQSAFNRKHDTILVYTKSKEYTFNANDVRVPYDATTIKTFASSSKAGFGKIPDLKRGKVPEDWWYFPVVARLHNERSGYPTQKPEALLERIIRASSYPGELVADFFCGSGTAPLVAARLGRVFIAADQSVRAVSTTRSRLAALPSASFSIETAYPANFEFDMERGAFLISKSAEEILITSSTEGLEYWEIDPDWDGITFRSKAQAVRPLRNGEIRQGLKIKPGGKVCLRLWMASGSHHQIEL